MNIRAGITGEPIYSLKGVEQDAQTLVKKSSLNRFLRTVNSPFCLQPYSIHVVSLQFMTYSSSLPSALGLWGSQPVLHFQSA